MKFLRLMLIVVAMMFSTNSNALIVMGNPSCGQWVKDRALQAGDQTDALINKAWLVGYLSGLATSKRINFLKNSEAESIYLFMDNYCQKNPLNYVDNGADELAADLIKRMH
jgi:hypothetical protein